MNKSKTYKEFESDVASKLSKYPFLNWKNKKTYRICKKMYIENKSISETVNFIILIS